LIRITGSGVGSGHGGAEAISHLVDAVDRLGALAPEHHLPELLRRLQGERASEE
jgi:hypothetical protein